MWEVGGRLRPLSEITGVCGRCKEQIEWKRRYGKYKPLREVLCSKRNVRQAYHNLCTGCAKDENACAKFRCQVQSLIGRDSSELEVEQKMLEEINDDEVEYWVVKAISAKLLDCKMDQMNELVIVSRCSERVFGQHQWELLEAELATWTENVASVITTIQANKITDDVAHAVQGLMIR